MPLQTGPLAAHPQSEVLDPRADAARGDLSRPLAVHTRGRRFHVEWDPHAAVTRLGQLVFFSQFLATAGLFRQWVQDCPHSFISPNAPRIADLPGTMTLAILAGQHRYAQITALRVDTVNPPGSGWQWCYACVRSGCFCSWALWVWRPASKVSIKPGEAQFGSPTHLKCRDLSPDTPSLRRAWTRRNPLVHWAETPAPPGKHNAKRGCATVKNHAVNGGQLP
jgi:hypothetical protein